MEPNSSQYIQNEEYPQHEDNPAAVTTDTTSAARTVPNSEPAYIEVERRVPAPGTSYAGHSHKDPSRKRPSGIVAAMLAGMLALGMLLGGAGAGAVMLVAGAPSAYSTQSVGAATASTSASSTSAELVAQTSEATINSIYKRVSPSVVLITSVVQSSNGRFGTTTGEASGTGIVVDSQGNILTNNHVIDSAQSIKVTLSDGSEYTATVVGTAPQDDLAIIKSDAPKSKLVPATLGDSSTVEVGDEVIAIGNPYDLDLSVTSGIVSGLDRNGSGSTSGRTLTGLIQVDAATNPGNSGGPLLNANGAVIGINTLIESPVEGFTGVGLAIPINHAISLLSQLEQGSTVQKPWLGISGMEITSGVQTIYNLPVGEGVLVMDVTPGSPASDAGLQASTTANSQGTQLSTVGDIITAIDGKTLGTVADLTNYLNGKQPGDTVTLSIVRDGQNQTVNLTLQAWSASAGQTTGS